MCSNAAFLAGARYQIKSPRFGSERRADVRFPASGTALLNGQVVDVHDISITGAKLVGARPCPTTAGHRNRLAGALTRRSEHLDAVFAGGPKAAGSPQADSAPRSPNATTGAADVA